MMLAMHIMSWCKVQSHKIEKITKLKVVLRYEIFIVKLLILHHVERKKKGLSICAEAEGNVISRAVSGRHY